MMQRVTQCHGFFTKLAFLLYVHGLVALLLFAQSDRTQVNGPALADDYCYIQNKGENQQIYIYYPTFLYCQCTLFRSTSIGWKKDGVDLISDGIFTIQNSLTEDQYKLSSNLTIVDPRQGGHYCCTLEGTSVFCVTVISSPPPLVNTSILECRHDVERGVYRTDVDCEVNMTTARARKNAILTVAINNSVSRTASSQSKDYWNSSYGNTTFYHKRETVAVENVYPGSLVQCRLQDSVIHRTIPGSSIIFRPDSWPSCQTPSASSSDSRLSTMDLVIMSLAVGAPVLVVAAIYFVVRFCPRFSAIRTKIQCLFCARSDDWDFDIEQPSCSSSPNHCPRQDSTSGSETAELDEVQSDGDIDESSLEHFVDGISVTSRRCDPSDVEDIPASSTYTADFNGARDHDCTPKKAESDMEEKIQSNLADIEQPSCSFSPNHCQDSTSESGNETVELNKVESDGGIEESSLDHLVDGISVTPKDSRRCDPRPLLGAGQFQQLIKKMDEVQESFIYDYPRGRRQSVDDGNAGKANETEV